MSVANYEIVLAKDLKPGDKTIYGEVKCFTEWPKPACTGTLEYGPFGHLKVYRSDREKDFRKFNKAFEKHNWFEKLGFKLGLLKKCSYDPQDCYPGDLNVRWIQIEENRPVIKVKETA